MTSEQHGRLEPLEAADAPPGSASGIGVVLDLNNLLQEIMTYAAMAKRRLDTNHPATSSLADIEAASSRAGSLVRKLIGERVAQHRDRDE